MNSLAHAWRRLVSRARRSIEPAAKPEYSAWLAERVASRKDRYPLGPAPYRYSVISLVYERSDARFLEEAHASLLAQSLPYFEWVVL
ncbi:MAG TPA: hypothetical protein VNT02_01120, partial [Burkholderiales bacterium]|nr:hypothetical protein [Burkholderiales bacterium]